MKIVCSYCHKVLKHIEPYDNKLTSHGICNMCYSKLLSEEPYDYEKKEWIKQTKP